ncbi:MAG: molybdopterin molybdotransferase MoeA [Terrimesophilobacter sp.]
MSADPLGTRPDWHSARSYAYRTPRRLPPESVPLSDAIGRVLADDIVALCDVPHYASSAMDGWAVAGGGHWRLTSSNRLAPGEAAAIVTGGLVPAGARAVLRSEHGAVHDVDGGQVVSVNDGARPGEPADGDNVRPAGEEVTRSDVVFRSGTRLNPAHVSVAAVCGYDELPVLRAPRVGLILTGDEVVASGIPEPGHVRDTFGPAFPALIRMLGGTATAARHLRDDLDLLLAAIADDTASEVLITTGGTGRSVVDHLHAALAQLKAGILIDGIAMRPGGPTLLAELPDGRYLIGLPGNPLAAMMGMLTVAQPLLAGLAGAAEPALGAVVTGRELTGRPGLCRLLPYQLQDGAAAKSQWFGSGMLRGLATADGVLVSPPAGARAGESVATVPLPW